jgi:putative DNA primase/helicase
LREIPAERLAEILGYTPKFRGEPLAGRVLLAPVTVGDALSTLELIDGDGRKSAIYGGQKAGGYWAAQRLPEDVQTLLIGEGVATVLSAREASGHAAVAALSCSNLKPVARTMRDRYPRARIIVLADIGNGQRDAEKAAQSVGASIALPDFGEHRPEDATDFNDMARLRGAESVRKAIEAAGNSDAGRNPFGVSLIHAASIEPEAISWRWDGWIAEGKLHVLAGAPGTGKTTLAMALAATITTGGRWPDGTPAVVGDVVIWSGEDDPKDTLVPRLIACGGDKARVHSTRQ